MPKVEEALIDKLTLRPEVREKARALLRTVHSKTGPGTGYDIGEAKTGLPAICAYIACKRCAPTSLHLRVYKIGCARSPVLVMPILLKKLPRRHPALHPRHSRAHSRQSKPHFSPPQRRRIALQVNLQMKLTRPPMLRLSVNTR